MKQFKKILASLFLSGCFIYSVYCIILNWIFFQPVFIMLLWIGGVVCFCWIFVWSVNILYPGKSSHHITKDDLGKEDGIVYKI